MRRPIAWSALSVMPGPTIGAIIEPANTSAGCIPRLAKLHSRCRNLANQTLDTAIIERYRRRESSVEEALMEMCLAGVSVRRIEDIIEVLWGTRASPSTVAELNKKMDVRIDGWRNAPNEGEHPYVYLDGVVMKQTWAGEVRNV